MDKEQDIAKQIAKISAAEEKNDYSAINQYLLDKRLSWMKQNLHLLNSLEGSDVRRAFEMVIIRYLGLNPKEVLVVEETANKIVWHSYNWCPVLEACQRLGKDTRKICQQGWESSVEAMAKLINPKIRFSRNYAQLRPYGDYCEEYFEITK
ncbi:MAG: hypothetical protein WCT37_01765 [Patescibacteria group bacterium]|jgi:hypothetical protein